MYIYIKSHMCIVNIDCKIMYVERKGDRGRGKGRAYNISL